MGQAKWRLKGLSLVKHEKMVRLRMSDDEGKGVDAKPTGDIYDDETVYDDEVEPYSNPLSDNMRSRLMKEASTGLDSESKQTNVILYISIAVVILVALGGKD